MNARLPTAVERLRPYPPLPVPLLPCPPGLCRFCGEQGDIGDHFSCLDALRGGETPKYTNHER